MRLLARNPHDVPSSDLADGFGVKSISLDDDDGDLVKVIEDEWSGLMQTPPAIEAKVP